MKTELRVSAAIASLLLAGCSQNAPRSADVDIALSAAELNDLQQIETAAGRNVPTDPKAVAEEALQHPIPLLVSVQLPMPIEKAASFSDKINWNGMSLVPKTGLASINQALSSLTPEERAALDTLDHIVDKAQDISAQEYAAAYKAQAQKSKHVSQPAPPVDPWED